MSFVEISAKTVVQEYQRFEKMVKRMKPTATIVNPPAAKIVYKKMANGVTVVWDKFKDNKGNITNEVGNIRFLDEGNNEEGLNNLHVSYQKYLSVSPSIHTHLPGRFADCRHSVPCTKTPTGLGFRKRRLKNRTCCCNCPAGLTQNCRSRTYRMDKTVFWGWEILSLANTPCSNFVLAYSL